MKCWTSAALKAQLVRQGGPKRSDIIETLVAFWPKQSRLVSQVLTDQGPLRSWGVHLVCTAFGSDVCPWRCVGNVVFLTIAVLGLSFIAKMFAGVFTAIKIASGLCLLYLAWEFWVADVEHLVERALWVATLSGAAISLGTAKVIVFHLALLPNIIDLAAATIVDWMVLSGIVVALLFGVLFPYSIVASRLWRAL